MIQDKLSDALDEDVFYYEDEGLFARDIDGQLIRLEKATGDDFDKDVHLTIDGQPITVKKAVPLRDSQGTVIRDSDGAPVPRLTTIYDAASELFVNEPGDQNPIPTLCHREHLPPVGACRVCMVEVYRTVRGRRLPDSKLIPSCVHRVEEGMEVQTIRSDNDPESGDRVRDAVKTVVELLVCDHLPENSRLAPSELDPTASELAQLAAKLEIAEIDFAPRTATRGRGRDLSSFQIAVDHDQCILCGRCQRGCNWVRKNKVIGKTGKGYLSTIAFDTDVPMGESTCVSCGECAISCPTGALEFQPDFVQRQIDRVRDEFEEEGREGEILTADQLVRIPLFSGIPYKFLQFNGAAVVRRKLKPGEVLCREGEYGATAFIINSGRFEIFLASSRGKVKTVRGKGLAGWLGGLKTFASVGNMRPALLSDCSAAALGSEERIFRGPEDVILGEMTCLNRYPRSATVVATEESEVLEIRRNVLYMLQRNAASRQILDRVYRDRALRGQLQRLPLLSDLQPEARDRAIELLRNRVDLISVDPGQTIFRQGEPADALYIVRLGFVKVSQRLGANDRVLNYLGPGNSFGEIGLLSRVTDLLETKMQRGIRPGARTASCAALDDVELIRIRGDAFRELLQAVPELEEPLLRQAETLLARDEVARKRIDPRGDDFLEQGLFNAQSLLVLDLESCTRCDECTKACADTHDGVTRLVRDGLRFDNFLVASSCRSCLDPYCLVGCPVDAIHRSGENLEIEIEDYCIGCGLCASNCPYGNINMHGFQEQRDDPATGKKVAVVQQRATTCDLCQSIDGRPSCVYACPHDAAFRMTGPELLERVSQHG